MTKARLAVLSLAAGMIFSIAITVLSWSVSGKFVEAVSYLLIPGELIMRVVYPKPGHSDPVELVGFLLSNGVVWTVIFFNLSKLFLVKSSPGARP